MQSPSKITSASASITSSVSELEGWADLPEGLLHSIVTLLGSFRDIVAFASACRTWRTAFSTYPSKSAFCALFPPLLVRPNVRVRARYVPSSRDSHKLYKCEAIDPANRKTALRCQIPEKMRPVGSSYGQLICCRGLGCLIVDVFTGARISPPYLPMTDDCDFYCAMLTVPLTSPNSHLLVCTGCNTLYGAQYYLLDWLVGGEVWSQHQLGDVCIHKIVDFNGKFIAMDQYQRLYTLSLDPQLGLQEINTVRFSYQRPGLVVCGNMLLMVDLRNRFFEDSVSCKVYRLDMLTEPATWVEVEKLENYSLFVAGDVRSMFSCVSPQQWGGRSNCLYYIHHNLPWSLLGLGDDGNAVRDDSTDPDLVFERDFDNQLYAFWVYPSMFA